jgi:hypothetical protein
VMWSTALRGGSLSRACLHLLGVRARPAFMFPKLGPGADGGTAGGIGGGAGRVSSSLQLHSNSELGPILQDEFSEWDPLQLRVPVMGRPFSRAFDYDRATWMWRRSIGTQFQLLLNCTFQPEFNYTNSNSRMGPLFLNMGPAMVEVHESPTSSYLDRS